MKKNKIKGSVVSLILSISLIVSSYLPVSSFAAPGDLGEPRSSYDLGYAGELKGRVVILSLFVNTPTTRWDVPSMHETLPKLETAVEYLSAASEKYDADVSFEYDWTKNRELRYRIGVSYEADDENFTDKADETVVGLVSSRLDYEVLKKETDADALFTILYFKEEGRSYAITYDGEDIPQETVIMFSDSDASTYAHEILHVFGAHDLYEDAEYTDDVVKYIKKKYPKEIMLKPEVKNGKIVSEISLLTAYHIGWADEFEDTKKYPQLER